MYELVEAMGVRVVEVDELEPPILLVATHGLAFVSRTLTLPERRDAAEALFLSLAVDPPSRRESA